MTDAYYDEGRVRLFLGDCREIVPALGLTAVTAILGGTP